MSLQRLEGFYWVARTGGYARAARAFPYPITAPGVHQQVKKLEGELGVRLLERTGKESLRCTPAGAQLYEHVAPFLELLPVLLHGISKGELSGRLRVRASSQILRHWLPGWLRVLERRHPGVQVDLDALGDADLEMLRRGATDIYIDYLSFVPPDIETARLGTFYPVLVLPARHRLARRRDFELKELEGEAFVAYSGGRPQRELQLQALRYLGITPARLVGASSSETILSLVAEGFGFSIVPLLPEGPRYPGVVGRRLDAPSAELPIYCAWRRTSANNPLVAAFREAAKPPRGAPPLGGVSASSAVEVTGTLEHQPRRRAVRSSARPSRKAPASSRSRAKR